MIATEDLDPALRVRDSRYSLLRLRLNIRTEPEHAKCFVAFKYRLKYTQTIYAHPLPYKGRVQIVCVQFQ